MRSFGVIGELLPRAVKGESAIWQDADRGGVVFRHTGVKWTRLFQGQESEETSIAMPNRFPIGVRNVGSRGGKRNSNSEARKPEKKSASALSGFLAFELDPSE